MRRHNLKVTCTPVDEIWCGWKARGVENKAAIRVDSEESYDMCRFFNKTHQNGENGVKQQEGDEKTVRIFR